VSSLGQDPFRVRFDWGVEGAAACGAGADVIVVVDVLSFSTAVDMAVSRGGTVIPMRWSDRRLADEVADRAGGTATTGPTQRDRPFRLAPSSMRAVTTGNVVVVPSPNGATISVEAAGLGAAVLCGCLRNARAVAAAAFETGSTIAVIAAGELWPGDGLRPAVEDGIGAGAILAHLPTNRLSPEARAAVALYRGADPRDLVRGSVSATQLAPEDVALATETDVSGTVPILAEGRYGAAR
jgi:2-phosphosulfolactate phosphatase